ncbi:MAG: heme lyase CcmF/NrfE family subunit [Gammaproteobacteria bacterium]|nr:heme lyase CcmF/NrfE family subunit [Gammaproteobacteria bacterium]
MLVELAHFSMILALVLSALQAWFGLAGGARNDERWMRAARTAVACQVVCTALGVAGLVHAFIGNDFSVLYVAQNSNSALPLFYRITALWGAHEGSMVLWIAILALWTVAFALCSRSLPRTVTARALGVLGIISCGFLLFTLTTSNPFLRLMPPAADGRDLNPLLQDFAMAMHPPILYTGYVGFSVSFALACAAMLEGRRDQSWARWMRPWTVLAWAFLGCGIALGSWWAYYELGWGGYWFWDPVENASFMPWLVGTALLHSLAVTDKRGLFKSWTLLLTVAAFSLSLLGTFLVRSGVLVSVHSFAADPARGVFILAFLALTIGGALALYAWRAPTLGSEAGFELLSREAFLLFNNILLAVAAAVVFGGTLAPLISETLGLGTLSVGAPYFNPSFLVPILPLLALLGVGIHARWRRGGLLQPARRLALLGGVALLLAIAIAAGVYGRHAVLTSLGLVLGLFILLSSLLDPLARLRRRQGLPAATLGMTIAHLGLGLFVLGITVVESATIERDVALVRGQSAEVGGYVFRYQGDEPLQGPNYQGVRGRVLVTRAGREIADLAPEKRRYFVQGSEMTEAAIDAGWNRDLFAAMGEDVGAGAWSLRLQYRPLIRFIWFGALVMALGGVIAICDRRYRPAARQPGEQPGTVATGAAGQAGVMP